MQIDEARRHDEALRIDLTSTLPRLDSSHPRDQSVFDADVAFVAGVSGAIDDEAVADDEVVGRGGGTHARSPRRLKS